MLDFFAELWNDFVDFSYSLLLSLLVMLKDLFYFILEQVFDLALLVLDGMGTLFNGLNISQYMSALPTQTISIISVIGLGEAMGMIVTCLSIRMLLQLIPFIRLGS
jgi:hypothetical protein